MIYDTIVIGAGPAGISAANYCNRLNVSTLMLYEKFGGQVNYCETIYSIPSAPAISARKLLHNYRETVRDVAKVNTTVVSVEKDHNHFVVITGKGNYYARTVIACTGAKPKTIAPEIITPGSTLPVLTYENYPFRILDSLDVAVIIGGGYVGLEIAHQLSSIVKEIIVVEKSDHLNANHNRRLVLEEFGNIRYFLNAVPVGIDKNRVLIRTGRKKVSISADCVFSAYGISPNTAVFSGLLSGMSPGVKIRRSGKPWQINMSKEVSGLFAAGDLADLPINGFVSFAEGMGIETAKAVYYYLKKHE